MAVLCPACHRQYDITLFQYGQGLRCDCGMEVNPFETTTVKGGAFAVEAKGRASGSPLAFSPYPWTRTAEGDPRAKPGSPAAVEIPVEGVLDLHTFQPSDVRDLVPEYLEACRGRGLFRIRIIHGKGTGSLRQTVHALLQGIPDVESYELAGPEEGGWGATIVRLKSGAGDANRKR